MVIKDLFNEAARWVIFAKRTSVFEREARKTEFPRERIDNVFEGFENRQNTFREFVQSSSSIASVCFSEQLEEEASSKKQITSWQEYFDLIRTAIKEIDESNLIDENDGFLGQLEYRTNIFEGYYKDQHEEMKRLLDIYASKLDIEDLYDRTEEAIRKISSEAAAQIKSISSPNIN